MELSIFPRLMAGLEIYVNGVNTIMDAVSATTMKQYNPELIGPQQSAMAFICKRFKLNYGKLTEEALFERKSLWVQ